MKALLIFPVLFIVLFTSAQTTLEFEDPVKQRVFVLTDITNEPDDQQSLVRFLVYANEYDIEGLVA
uniref:nucleoside hydrolase-like domain-containing protein n=1 Tax=Cecembia sp. TaxID=1898110 RepID=UPI0025B9E2B5